MNEVKHIGLQVSSIDVACFYTDVLGATIGDSFVLSSADALLIFGIEKQIHVYWCYVHGFTLELFVVDEKIRASCHHICFLTAHAEEIVNRAKHNGYSLYIRKKYETDTYFITNTLGNLFEIKSA
jgi:hypothetical protein